MELGKNIQKIRKDNNLTQDDFANKYYVTRQTISNWETGKSYPDLETLVKISNDFNISLDILLKEDDKMVKAIDKKVKATKKYKHLLIYVIIFVCLLAFIGYKIIILNKYHAEIREDVDTSKIFNKTLTIKDEEYDGDYITFDGISIPNYFEGYVDTELESTFRVKRDENEVIAFYSTGSTLQMVNIMDIQNLELATDDTEYNPVETSEQVRKYLNKHNIKNDIDLMKYVKDNYYFKSNIFTSTNKIKINYLLNSFVSVSFPSFDSITLINGKFDGYIFNVGNSPKGLKQLHIIKDDKLYYMVLGGEENTSDEFITKLLSGIKFN